MPNACLLLLVLALVAPPARAEAGPLGDALRGQIDALFAEWDRWDSPGAALAVLRNGEVIYSRGYGSANLEYRIPITPQTPFHVASVSKQFTCFAVVLLAQEGRLSLDDDVREHVPEVPDFGTPITLRQLAHHTSGLRDQLELLAMAGWRLDDVMTREQILRMVARQRDLNFEPGSQHLYSNTGYTLLAEVVARVSGQSFAEFTAERIFRPLGMSRSHFHDDHRMIVPGRAYSYGRTETGFEKLVLSFAYVGSTSLFTTVEDLGRWLTNLERGSVGGAAAIAQMHERGTLLDGTTIDYALGLTHFRYRGLDAVGHGGSDAGFRSLVVRFPDEGVGIVVLGNFASFAAADKALQVADLLLADRLEPKSEESPEAAGAVAVAAEVLDRYVGPYQLDIGALVIVTRRAGGLVGEFPEVGTAELVPLSETEFLVRERDVRIRFQVEDSGAVRGFEAQLGDARLAAKRIERASVDVDDLLGRYYSPELETTYSIVLSEGRLVARHQRHPDIALVPVGKDELAGGEWFFGRLRFERDTDGAVSGLLVSGGRVRELRFERQ